MDLDYVTVDEARSLDGVAERVRRHEERTGRFPTIFVTDDGTLLGELPAPVMSLAGTEDISIAEYVEATPSVRYDVPDTEEVDVFRAHPESRVAVLDEPLAKVTDPCTGR